MENLNAEQIKRALECCSDAYDCFTCDIYKRKCIGGFRESMAKKALALITSQEQRIGAQDMTISELRKRVEKAEHDADRYAQRIKELTVDLEAMRGAANSYKMHNKELTAKVKEWEEECDLRGDMWCKLNEENKRLTEEKERLLTALANYDRLTDVRIAEEYYTTEAYEELREENENLRTESDRLKARTLEALTEFAESVKRYYSALPGATVGAAVRFYVDEKLKEALDKI